jgi:hypothetical protein
VPAPQFEQDCKSLRPQLNGAAVQVKQLRLIQIERVSVQPQAGHEHASAIHRSGPVKREKQAKRRSVVRSEPPIQRWVIYAKDFEIRNPVAVSGYCGVAVMGLQRARARR